MFRKVFIHFAGDHRSVNILVLCPKSVFAYFTCSVEGFLKLLIISHKVWQSFFIYYCFFRLSFFDSFSNNIFTETDKCMLIYVGAWRRQQSFKLYVTPQSRGIFCFLYQSSICNKIVPYLIFAICTSLRDKKIQQEVVF